MLNRVGRVAAAVTVSAAIAASCGTAEPQESAPPTTTQSPVLSTPSTPPVTDPPATTTPPPTTSPAPETTSPEAVEQEVINAYLAAWNAFNEAVKDPSDPDARAAVDATHTGASLIGANEILDQLRTSGYRSAVNRDSPARTAVESQVTLEGSTAFVTICEIDSNIVVEPESAPDGSDAVVNDDVRALRLRVRLESSPSGWKLESGETLGEWSGSDECEPAL